MPSLTMPLADAILACKALLHHTSTDDVTPVICGAAVVDHEGRFYLVATDRYSFGRFLLTTSDNVDVESGAMIPNGALDWVSKINVKGLRNQYALILDPDQGGYVIRWSWGINPDGMSTTQFSEVEVAIVRSDKTERTQTFDVPSFGKFPSVARLYDEDRATSRLLPPSVMLSHSSLVKVAADTLLFHGKGTTGAVALQFASGEDGKPLPVQYELGISGRWTAALQPNLLLR